MKLYHYTSVNAALRIISKEGLCFHASRYEDMNDPHDSIYAKEKLLPLITQQEMDNTFEPVPYIVSFSKAHNDKIMWEMYHAEVALEIDTDMLPLEEWRAQEGDCGDMYVFSDVQYVDLDKDHAKVVEAMNKLLCNQNQFAENKVEALLYNVYPFIKHPAYAHEHEFRIVKSDYITSLVKYAPESLDKCEFSDAETKQGVKVRDIKDGHPRYYRDFLFPLESLTHIWMRSNNELLDINRNRLLLVLKECGISHDANFVEEAI